MILAVNQAVVYQIQQPKSFFNSKIAKTPYQRVLESEYISDEVKEKLRQEHAKLNPLIMKNEIDRLKKILYDTQRKHGTTEF